MDCIFKAELNSRNFCFEGYGVTAEQAVKAVETAWNAHAEYSIAAGRPVPLFDEIYENGATVRDFFEVSAREFVLGQGYRDSEPIGPKVNADPAAATQSIRKKP